MNSTDLSLEQLRALLEREERNLQSCAAVLLRTREKRFPVEDPLRGQFEAAEGVAMQVRMWLHYAVCMTSRLTRMD